MSQRPASRRPVNDHAVWLRRVLRWCSLSGVALIVGAASPRGAPALVEPNPNIHRAGTLHDGVLTVALEAAEHTWQSDGPKRPAERIAAFSEAGQAPLVPGPLLRVTAGTEIRLTVRNFLAAPLTFFVPAAVHGGPDALNKADSVVIGPGAVGQLTTRATAPGGYVYRATLPTGESRVAHVAGLLAGALVVDSASPARPPNDRVFVLMATPDSVRTAYADTSSARINIGFLQVGRITYTINGRSWPNTERVAAVVGDSLHWRIINATSDVHPMHLHGFYFRIDGLSGPWPPFAIYDKPALGEMAVTQLVWPFDAMTMTWSPNRAGNWLFHCHFAPHLDPDSINAAPDDPHLRDMVGLVLGTIVAERPGTRPAAASSDTNARRLRLVAVADSDNMPAFHGYPRVESLPHMHFVLEEQGRRVDAGKDFSPELDLTRGEPVAITVVNRLPEPTSVHWHGIEIQDSYVDGVPGFSGAGRRLTPEIAPGDSFVARFTPPRSGTFMYHAHVDELREQLAGLEGAIIVRDPGTQLSADDHVFFLKGYEPDAAHPFGINGRANPDTVVMHVGQPARLRFINLTTINIAPYVALTAQTDSSLGTARDTMILKWRPVAKDGADLPPSSQRAHLARQTIGVGETYDFEYTPTHAGPLHIEVRGNGGKRLLLALVPIRVE